MIAARQLLAARNIQSRNIFPFSMEGVVAYLPLWQEDMQGATILSYDQYHHAGTVTGATWGNQGRTLDGVADRINCGSNSVLNLLNALTVEVFLNPDATNPVSYGRYVVKANTAENGVVYGLGMEAADETQLRWDLSFAVLNSAAGAITAGSFNHLVGTYDKDAAGQNVQCYVNGVSVANDRQTTALTSSTGNLYIGGGISNVQWWKGVFGEVSIYNRALSAGEILHNYQATKWRYA